MADSLDTVKAGPGNVVSVEGGPAQTQARFNLDSEDPGRRGWGQGGLRQRRAKNRNEVCALQSVFDTELTVNSLQSWVASAWMTFDIVADIVADIQASSIS